jgi:hypothetical protein
VQTFTRGCLTVFTAVLAIDVLHTGNPGVGVLTAAVGAGGMLGSLFAFRLVGRGRLAFWFGVGVALFGAPLVAVGADPEQVPAILLLGLIGIGNALIDVGVSPCLPGSPTRPSWPVCSPDSRRSSRSGSPPGACSRR